MPRSVLIVNDEQHIRLLIEQALEDLLDGGIELWTASDGDEALAVIEVRGLDLVFLDLTMPKRNGLDVCRAVRGDLGLVDTCLVLLTAKGAAHDRDAGLSVGWCGPDPVRAGNSTLRRWGTSTSGPFRITPPRGYGRVPPR